MSILGLSFTEHAVAQCNNRFIMREQVSLAIQSLQKKLRKIKTNDKLMIVDRVHEASYVCTVKPSKDHEEGDQKVVVVTVIDKDNVFAKDGTQILYHK